MTGGYQNNILQALGGSLLDVPPIWMMRQAGRYLPEYRELRTKAATFMDFCFNPKMTVEATLQPIRRFDLDAAIIFSDILVIPHRLGQTVSFETGKGPMLEPITAETGLSVLKGQIDLESLSPVFEALQLVRAQLPASKALIGFCGAPWTVASYMIAGHGTPDQAPARLFAYSHPELFAELIDRLVDASIDYLCKQVDAGADVLQIFDSWAGVLPVLEFDKWSLQPITRLVEEVKKRHPDTPIIAFPRGAGTHLTRFAELAGVDCIGLDTSAELAWAAAHIQPKKCVQGNLDPLALVAGGAELDKSIDQILDALGSGPFIFNLGHGIVPQTPIANVERMLARVRGRS